MCGRYYMDIEAEESVYEFLNSVSGSPLSTGGTASGGISVGTTLSTEGIRPGTASRPGEIRSGSDSRSGEIRSGSDSRPGEIRSGSDSRPGEIRSGSGSRPGEIRSGTAANNLRDILPSDKALLITGRKGLRAEQMRWGFPAAQSGKLLINARAETALHKPTFSDSVLRRRCVIPAAGFYEWDAARNKVTFTLPKSPCLFMAGFFRPYGDDIRFIILTTAANNSMRPVHDRMPLILPPEAISDWILAPDKTADYLRAASPELLGHREYEQMTLPFV